MNLTEQEKNYLFSKLEYRKKKISMEIENDLFHLLKGDKIRFSDDEFKTIINSLEYAFRKRLMNGPDFRNDVFLSIKDKIPNDLNI